MVEEAVAQQGSQVIERVGLIDRIKTQLNTETIMDRLRTSKNKLIEMGIYLGAGFVVGFLLKRYAQYVVVGILCLIGLVVLQQMGVLEIVINWDKVQEVFGIQVVPNGANVMNVYWEWIKLNFTLVLSFSVGFLLGLKVG